MKITFAILPLAVTLVSLNYVASVTIPENCQRPVNITAVSPAMSLGDFISNEKLCGSTICVDAGEARLLGATSQVCQAQGLKQGVFKCNKAKTVSKKQSNAAGDVGYDYCSLPSHSTTVAEFQCPKGGASVSVFTTKDGKSSFYVSKEKASQPGAAYYRSMATRGCTPWSVTGATDVTNDELLINCDSKTVQCTST